MASMVYSAKTLVLQIVIPVTATGIQAIVTPDALLVSLAICATNNVLLTVLAIVTKSAVLVQSAQKVSLLENVVNVALKNVRVAAIKLMESVTKVARLVSMGMSVIGFARVIVIQLDVSKALDIVLVNVKLDFMVAIATTPAPKTVIHQNVIRSQAPVLTTVLMVSMATNVCKFAQRIATIHVTGKQVLVALAKKDSLVIIVQITVIKIARMVVIV